MKVTKSDLIGLIKDYPIEIVERMLEEQVRQGNRENIKVFQKALSSGRGKGGFNWFATREGVSFWKEIIEKNNFNEFFKLYPKKEEKQVEVKQDEPTQAATQYTKETQSKVFVDIAHDYVLFETRDNHANVLAQIQIPIVEFTDIMIMLRNHPNLQFNHACNYPPMFDKVEIQDGNWIYSREYITAQCAG